MKNIDKEIWNDISDLVIEVNDGEIAVCTGEFYGMRKKGLFVSEYEDPEDTIKLYGITADGKTYVSEKDDFDKTDEEFALWSKRISEKLPPLHIVMHSVANYRANVQTKQRR